MNNSQLKTFLGWCAVINMGLLLLNSWMYIIFKGFITDIWISLFGSSEEQFTLMYTLAIAFWKILIFTFFIIPYFVLRIMQKQKA